MPKTHKNLVKLVTLQIKLVSCVKIGKDYIQSYFFKKACNAKSKSRFDAHKTDYLHFLLLAFSDVCKYANDYLHFPLLAYSDTSDMQILLAFSVTCIFSAPHLSCCWNIDRFEESVIEERRRTAQDLLNFIGQRNYLTNSVIFKQFFQVLVFALKIYIFCTSCSKTSWYNDGIWEFGKYHIVVFYLIVFCLLKAAVQPSKSLTKSLILPDIPSPLQCFCII